MTPVHTRGARLVLVVLALGASTGCPRPDQDLPFTVLDTCFRRDSPLETVLRSREDWNALVAASHAPPHPSTPDFAQRQVAVRLEGAGSACVRFTVQEVVLRSGSRIVVRGTRHAPDTPCVAAIAYPQLTVAFERPPLDYPVLFDLAASRSAPPEAGRGCF